MTTFTRRNAWNNDGTFDNPDLYWYALGVREMQSRSLDDPTSWWFFAAIHGDRWLGNQLPSNVPSTPIPSQSLKEQYWAQCQHGSWFFLPWHRGYLYAIENVLREIIQEKGGPADWALPYWNYFGSKGPQHLIPPAFTQLTMQDGSPNPLYIIQRYGIDGKGNIYIDLSQVTQECQKKTNYIGAEYYGGGETGFQHNPKIAGSLEYNPHNGVHTQIGGRLPGRQGLMSNAETAGLDPIFYLHHCNIDRMWAAWNANGRNNPNEPNWNDGPVATKDRKFYMPKPDKTPWQFTPAMVNDTSQLDYTYVELSLGVTQPLLSKNVLRLVNFGIEFSAINNIDDMKQDGNTELIGANKGSIALDATGARTTVKLDSKGLNTVAKSFKNTFSALASENVGPFSLPDEVFLELEGIRGNADANIYSVTINQHFVGHVFLFGLQAASERDGKHGGGGLNIIFDITKIIDQLHMSDDDVSKLNSLDVVIQPTGPVYENEKCVIERVSIYRKGQL
ncbi:hypothetical protein Flavo103_44470 [Flavobacterium collinsii]|uniref:tyrosinase family protein n=1 Tax=Flavobacterium collinsii TaxID=1114861 RepID=UPI0022CC9482|nr:tyrosinase family protein [Flavobacterium collinsii]GIQ61312.1 hypothetical protein Flavo103_44470 [Flavobacterium collinsii]